MKKFFAVVKREYVQRVRTKFFVVATILGPLLMLLFTVVPAFMAGIKAGGPTRIAVADETGRLYERFRDSLMREREEEEDRTPPTATTVRPNTNRQTQLTQAAK